MSQATTVRCLGEWTIGRDEPRIGLEKVGCKAVTRLFLGGCSAAMVDPAGLSEKQASQSNLARALSRLGTQ